MAADNETRLLSRAIKDRDVSLLLERGVAEDWFASSDDRAVWKFVRSHYSKYGEVPTAVTVKDNFPNYRILNVEDKIEYMLDQIVEYRRRQHIVGSVREAARHISEEDDYEAALLAMSKGIATLESGGFSEQVDYDLTSTATSRWDEYLARKDLPGGLLGLPTGIPTIDRATSGLQKGQLVTIIAPPKTGKSTLSLQIALNIHSLGYVPYFRSFEMSNAEQTSRYDAMRAGVSHQRLMTGTLSSEEEEKLSRALRQTSKMEHKFWLGDSAAGNTVSALEAKIQHHQPDIVFVDGVYLMVDEQTGEHNTPQALTNITRSFKRLAQRRDICLVISTQVLNWKLKKGNVTADAIGYSSSFYQDSDVILGLQRPAEDMDDVRLLKVVASRNCPNTETQMLWDWEGSTFKEWSAEDEY